MFDTMTVTKIAAGVIGAWLILLLGKWAGEEIYHAEAHGEQSYVIEVASTEDAGVPEMPFEDMMASADVEKGEKIFKKCTSCHKVAEGENSTGPHLYGVVGRDIASVGDFGYSGSLEALEGNWSPLTLSGFLEKPGTYVSGTSMSFAGLKKIEDRANVIAYLDSLDD